MSTQQAITSHKAIRQIQVMQWISVHRASAAAVTAMAASAVNGATVMSAWKTALSVATVALRHLLLLTIHHQMRL